MAYDHNFMSGTATSTYHVAATRHDYQQRMCMDVFVYVLSIIGVWTGAIHPMIIAL